MVLGVERGGVFPVLSPGQLMDRFIGQEDHQRELNTLLTAYSPHHWQLRRVQ